MNRIIQTEKITDSIYRVKVDRNEYVFSFNMPSEVVLRELNRHEFLSRREQEELLRCLNGMARRRQ